jgi:SAM-dependent methyltransferase
MNAADEQSALWNGPSGRAWVESQELLDGMLRPMGEALSSALDFERCRRVLDVGCGTGTTTLAVARRVGERGRVTGADLSEPMLALARTRAEREKTPPEFVVANAQTYAFEPASFDAIISRFGVMFFEDPVEAFANLRRAAKPGGELRFIAWRSAAENPFMTTAERAATPLLPNLPPRRPDGPGQFAFGDRDRVEKILAASGWTEIDIRPVDYPCTLPAKDLDRYLTRLGPLGRLLDDVDAAGRADVFAKIRGAFDPYVHGDEVRFTSACWLAAARA